MIDSITCAIGRRFQGSASARWSSARWNTHASVGVVALHVVDVGQQVEQADVLERLARPRGLLEAAQGALDGRRARSRPAAHEAAVQPHGVHHGVEVAPAELAR